MLEKFIYENHLGKRFVGLDFGVYLNSNELRDYSWKFDTINDRISRFYRSMKNRKLPLVVMCDSDEEAVYAKNRLHELAEADIEAKIPGRIFVGDFYTIGYITASTKSNYLNDKRICNIQLTLTSDDPAWYREQTYSFLVGGVDDDTDEDTDDDSGGIKPEGTLTITSNGVFDVTRYAAVHVDVETGTGGGGEISVTHDGNGNVTLFNVASTDNGDGHITIT